MTVTIASLLFVGAALTGVTILINYLEEEGY